MTGVRRRAGWLAIVLASTVAACGVTSQDEPHVIRDAALPPEPTTSRPVSPAVVDARVYFVRDDTPVPVLRRAAGTGLDDVLDALLAGPTDDEVATGVRTALPAGTVDVVERVDGIATLEVGSLLDGITGQEQILVFAQIVLTATSAPDIDGVVFLRDGKRVDAPTVDGTLLSRPITAGDYEALLSPS